ncbi:MAG: hypothetical protein WC314_08975 [Vulcanimicrobiota bacterium]
MSERSALLSKSISYDGEDYNRDTLEAMVKDYGEKHETRIGELEELKKTHDSISREMTDELAEQKTVWDCVKDMTSGEKGAVSANMRLLLERIPMLKDRLPDRPISELLQQKIHVTETRIREVGGFLDRMESEIENVRQDIVRLNKKMIVAAQNEEKAAEYVLQLRQIKEQAEEELAAMGDTTTAAHREKEAEIDEIKRAIWQHGGKLRLYSNAEDRIASIVKMNNHFMELLTNLHTNMQSLYDAGQEVLDELRGNLSSLSTATEASELTLEMQKSMESLKVSVNRVARLASDTSLYLTQNVDRMTSQMKIYDEETEALVSANLEAEREVREGRIDEVLKLAEAEQKSRLLGDGGGGEGTPA